jgi:hypothetical protein
VDLRLDPATVQILETLGDGETRTETIERLIWEEWERERGTTK